MHEKMLDSISALSPFKCVVFIFNKRSNYFWYNFFFRYYNSKALKEEDPKAALESFQRVLDLENGEKGEWGFKALKQMIKINFRLQNFEEMMRRYKQLLTYIKSAVTRNHSEKSINSILDYISTSKQMELLQVCWMNFRW